MARRAAPFVDELFRGHRRKHAVRSAADHLFSRLRRGTRPKTALANKRPSTRPLRGLLRMRDVGDRIEGIASS